MLLSIPTTSKPFSAKNFTASEPMSPADPVTSARIRMIPSLFMNDYTESIDVKYVPVKVLSNKIMLKQTEKYFRVRNNENCNYWDRVCWAGDGHMFGRNRSRCDVC